MKKIGVVLSGCGFQDGTEIQEAVLTLLAIDRAGAEAVSLAPNIDQAVVVDHLDGQEKRLPGEARRNVLRESARIARGHIRDIAECRAEELDALILPGGYGAALNLSSFAKNGAKAEVDDGVQRLLVAMFEQHKPIGAICIAPALVARVLGRHGVSVTIGTDTSTAKEVEATGARHVSCPVEGIIVDEKHKIVSTPAYMLGPSIRHVAAGIELCVAEVLRMA